MNRIARTAHSDGRHVEVVWSDGLRSRYLSMWLRDNCPQLRHATTRHRTVETSLIPDDVQPRSVTVGAAGEVVIVWAHDGHTSTFDSAWLESNDYSNGARNPRRQVELWDASDVERLPRASWPEVLADADLRVEFLRGFFRFGLAFLTDVPTTPGTVLEVANELGYVRLTSWGEVFDVISMPDANSLAYTSLPLVVHTDEGYRDPAPTVQLQHFLVADSTGGLATLTDGFRVATDLKAASPDQFDLLARNELYFHFEDATAIHWHTGPVITADADGAVRAVRYSNHSAQPFLMDPDELEAYYEAYRRFATMRESEQYQLRVVMRAGDMYIVDNRRVMHGRTAFSADGPRHLQSCYIERDELASRLAVLERRFT
jgi:alpha-ketoglutarate-dependent taurine dioxygenase